MLEFLRHALALTATVQGQLALLVRLQWIAGKRVAEMMTAAPFAAVLGADATHPLVRHGRAHQRRPAPSRLGGIRPRTSARTTAGSALRVIGGAVECFHAGPAPLGSELGYFHVDF